MYIDTHARSPADKVYVNVCTDVYVYTCTNISMYINIYVHTHVGSKHLRFSAREGRVKDLR